MTGTEVTPPPLFLEPSELSFNATPSRQPSHPDSYPVDELVECEVDQAMLQEGPRPAQVIGAVARHMGQAPGRQMDRQVGHVDQGQWGKRGTQEPQGRGPAARQGTTSNIHAGRGPDSSTCRAEPGVAEPAASCWGEGGWTGGAGRGHSLLTDDVECLGNFQVAPGLERESWMWMKSKGVRGGEKDREQGQREKGLDNGKERQ